MEQAKIHCPKRYQAMLAWFEYVNTVLSDLEPKTNHMFYFTGKHRSTPSCPVQLAANFNPGTGSQKYKSSNKDCTKPALYRLPFFMENLGPRYNAFSVAAHEARPGHHTQSQREEDQYSKMKTHFNAVFFMAAVFLIVLLPEGFSLDCHTCYSSLSWDDCLKSSRVINCSLFDPEAVCIKMIQAKAANI
ncbi:hypothetical protein OS493_003724 [Desmophyllum pertusum]|uniref:Uncharacterized protein n=1 Tax=Desmophyllum pertusum TaxID=174260 RepID=A0A9X0A605_9CNID|nr:hypothetical protein OS493_003724 [Desmophyllum pertusum]